MNAAARKPLSFWLILALGMLLFWLYPFAARVLVETGGMERTTGWSAGRGPDGRLQVTEVDPDGPAAGTLRLGDEPLAINGHGPLSRGLGWVLFVDLRPGDLYTIRVVRGADTLEFSLPMTERPNAPKLWLLQVPLLLVSFVFYVTGLGVGLLGARDRVEIRDLDAVLQRCLAKDHQARFSSASEMQAALLPALAACPSFGGAGHVDALRFRVGPQCSGRAGCGGKGRWSPFWCSRWRSLWAPALSP